MPFESYKWDDIRDLYGHLELGAVAMRIPDIAMSSKAASTNKKYDGYFQKFEDWCKLYGFVPLPAKVNTVCVFLSYLVGKKVSVALLHSYFYAINWKHNLSLLTNPCEDKLSKMILEGSKRILAVPVKRKEPLSVEMLRKIVTFYSSNSNLKSVRLCTLVILGFSGFLKYSEIADLRMKDIQIFKEHIQINIKCSKTDQYRQGQNIIIAKTGSDLCPVSWVNKYIAVANLIPESEQYLFSPVKYIKSLDSYILSGTKLSYTRAREIFHEAIEAIGQDKNLFCLHSLRSGGCSAATNSEVEERLVMAHGRWKRISSKDGYVKNEFSKRISVSKNLGI